MLWLYAIWPMLFGSLGPGEIQSSAITTVITAAQGIGILPEHGGDSATGRENIDGDFHSHDARRQSKGEPSLRATSWEEAEGGGTDKPSKEVITKTHTLLAEFAGKTTTTTTTSTTSTPYTWHPTEWELNQVEVKTKKRSVREKVDVTNDHSMNLGTQNRDVTTAVSTLLMTVAIQILMKGQYPEGIQSHVLKHCSWISSVSLGKELAADTPACRMFKEGGTFIHCQDQVTKNTCQLPVILSFDPLSKKANIAGKVLLQAGVGLNLGVADGHTPMRRQLQEQVEQAYQHLHNEDFALTRIEEDVLNHGQKAFERLQKIFADQPHLVTQIDRGTVEALDQPEGIQMEELKTLGKEVTSYLSLRSKGTAPRRTSNIMGTRKAATFMNEYMKTIDQGSWEDGLQRLWQEYDQQGMKAEFEKEDLLEAIDRIEENTNIEILDEETSNRTRRSNEPGHSAWQPASGDLTGEWFHGRRSEALNEENDRWDGLRHGRQYDDGSGPDPRCGPNAPGTPPGRSMECSRYGPRPCCSGAGFCGWSRNHCDCHFCTDYSPLNYHEVREARGLPPNKPIWREEPIPGQYTQYSPQEEHPASELRRQEERAREDSYGPDVNIHNLDDGDRDNIRRAVRAGKRTAHLLPEGSLGRQWQIEDNHEGTVNWSHQRTLLEYEEVASVILVEDLGPIVNVLERIVDYHKKKKVTFSADPDNAIHRNMPIYYTNLGIKSPYSLYNTSSNTTLFNNLSQDIGTSWTDESKYSRVPFWSANDAIIEAIAREAGVCLEDLLNGIKLYHPDMDSETESRMKRQILSLLMAGVGAAMGLAGLGAGVSSISQAAQNHADVVKLSTRLNAIQAGVFTISKRQQLELTAEHAILRVLDDMAKDQQESQRESLALVSQNLLKQSKDQACKKAEDTIRHMETLRKKTLPLGLVNQELLEGALAKIRVRAMSIGLYPSVSSLTQFLQLPTTSLIVKTTRSEEKNKELFDEHKEAVTKLGIKKFYNARNITERPHHSPLENHHNDTGRLKEDANGPGVFHPEGIFLEIRTKIPLIRSGQEVYHVKSLELGIIKITENNNTKYFTLDHDDWLAISDSGEAFQLRHDYFKDCIQNNDHYVCPRVPRPPSDNCLVSLKAGRENRGCLKKMVALDGNRPYLVRSKEDDRVALGYVPDNHNIILRCPAPSRVAANLTLEWVLPRGRKTGLLKFKAPYHYCSISIPKNGYPDKGPSIYFLPTEEEERIYLGRKTEMKDLLTLLGLYNQNTGAIRSDTGYTKNYLEARKFLNKLNVTMEEIDNVQQLQPWDLIRLDSSSVKLAVSISILSASLAFGTLFCCGWYHCRKNQKKTARVRLALQRDRALREQAGPAQALINRNTVRFV